MLSFEQFYLQLLGFGIMGYLLGSIPFGLILAKSAGLGDIRKTGSGNIGATNVLRTGNKSIAALTLLLDMAKAAIAVAAAVLLTEPLFTENGKAIPALAVYVAGMGALLGHIYPVWLNFKGGKGVASYFGVLLSLNWQSFLIAALNWIVIFYLKRISSLAAIITALFIPIWLYIFTDSTGLIFGTVYSILIIYKHAANIKRLLQGTEQKFGTKNNDTP